MSDASEPPPESAPLGPRWRRRVLGGCCGGLLLLLLPLAATVFHLRHVPYAVPPELQPPTSVRPGTTMGTGLRLTWLGIGGFELTDGRTEVLLDPTLTRPTFLEALGGPLESDPALVARFRRADFILVSHGHYDHVLDVPAIALRTGATVIGPPSVVNLALSRGVPPGKTLAVRPGERIPLGTFTLDVRTTPHAALGGLYEPFPGLIPPDAGPLWFWEYRNDGVLSYRLEAKGTAVWFHPTSRYDPGELGGLTAETLILGVSGEPLTPEVVRGILQEAKPRRVIPTHYDNFLQPRASGLSLHPDVDMEATVDLIRHPDPNLEVWVPTYDQAIDLPSR